MNTVRRYFLRAAFRAEWSWRLFIVLEGIGALFVVVLDATSVFRTQKWDFFPDFFTPFYWQLGEANWYVVYLLVMALLIAKAVDWVYDGWDRTTHK